MTTPANEEQTVVEYELDSVVPKNVGHLLDDPVEFVCPACHQASRTRVVHEAVTFLQKLVAVVNCCLCCSPIKWSGRHDVNHYCGKCGCYIGRKIAVSWYKRKLFRMQNFDVDGSSWQKFRKIEKEHLDKNKQKHTAKSNDTTNETNGEQQQ